MGAAMTITELDQLEDHLMHARVLSHARGPHGAHPSYRLLLEGGVYAIAKPSDEGQDADQMVAREVAAWALARRFGWSDLVGATVLRTLPSQVSPGTEVPYSVQVLWPDPVDNAEPLNMYDDGDLLRAATFDVAIRATDRSHNWLRVLDPPHLKLVDHGHAFDFPGRGFDSRLVMEKNGAQLPPEILDALGRMLAAGPGMVLLELTGDDACRRMMGRVERMFKDSRIAPP
jgi:hypothetical protein